MKFIYFSISSHQLKIEFLSFSTILHIKKIISIFFLLIVACLTSSSQYFMHIQDENKSIQSEYIFRNEHRGLLRFFFYPPTDIWDSSLVVFRVVSWGIKKNRNKPLWNEEWEIEPERPHLTITGTRIQEIQSKTVLDTRRQNTYPTEYDYPERWRCSDQWMMYWTFCGI